MRPGVTDIDSQIIADEGFRGSAYQDGLGYWTIGIGTCIDARKGCTISLPEATTLMENRLADAMVQVQKNLPWTSKLDTVRLGVLQNMTYQMGFSGLSQFHDFLLALEAGDYVGASEAGLDSKWAKVQSPARATRLMQQIVTGEWQ